MRKNILIWVLAFMTLSTFSQQISYQLSSHILDISKGLPAAGVPIRLEKLNEEVTTWAFVDEKITDKNGRISDFLSSDNINRGIYKLTFLTKDYFAKDTIESFYPFIEVVFEIKDNAHYHVPITLSPFGYSTYRGN